MGQQSGGFGGGAEAPEGPSKHHEPRSRESPRVTSGAPKGVRGPRPRVTSHITKGEGTGRPNVPTGWTKTKKAHHKPKATHRGRKNSCNPYAYRTFLWVEL